MIIPGSNLLNMALGVIGSTQAQWLRVTGRTQNALGDWITQYASPITVSGSWQPVTADKYEQLGLDMKKKYWSFFSSQNIQGIDRDKASDKLIVNGNTYDIEREADWFLVDGWKGVICIEGKPND